MSFLLLLALAAAAGMAWRLERRLSVIESTLNSLQTALARGAEPPSDSTTSDAPPEPNPGVTSADLPARDEQRRVRNPLQVGRQYVATAEEEYEVRDARRAIQDSPPPGPGEEMERDIRDLSGAPTPPVTAEEPVTNTVTPRPSPETGAVEDEGGAASASSIDTSAVKSLYARWVRDQVRPDEPDGWEVVPLRFVRVHQEHPAAVPVSLFEDAGQIGGFVRFSQAGDAEAYVLPHPDAAHNREHFSLVFPEADPALLSNARNLLNLDPVRMRRSGRYWQSQ
jgi:hypothetical protein